MLADQVDELIDMLKVYSDFIRNKKADMLHDILKRGRLRKEQVDGKVLK